MTGVHRRLWTRPFTCEHNTMAELLGATQVKENRVLKCTFAVMGIMRSLLIYGILQEKIMRIPYGINKEYFRYSLFFVFCNCIMTSAVSAGVLLVWGTLIMQKKYNGKDYLFALLVTIRCVVFILYPGLSIGLNLVWLSISILWQWEETLTFKMDMMATARVGYRL